MSIRRVVDPSRDAYSFEIDGITYSENNGECKITGSHRDIVYEPDADVFGTDVCVTRHAKMKVVR